MLTRRRQTKVTTTYHASEAGKGELTLRTYDPVSGAVVKFRTSKIADVGRLVAGLHGLARVQTGAPEAAQEGTFRQRGKKERLSANTPALQMLTPR